jgi:hypothetical protein
MMPWATVRQTPRLGCYQPIYMKGFAELSHTANASSTVDSTGLDRMLVLVLDEEVIMLHTQLG